MINHSLMVKTFHQKHGLEIGTTPSIRSAQWYIERIIEESKEVFDAYAKEDLVKVVDGFCDLLYIVHGAAIACGVDINPLFEEVHRSNMTKPVKLDPGTNKISKDGWTPPDLKAILIRQFEESLK